MSEPLREIEGTWEEVAAHEAELRGHQVKLTVLDGNGATPEAPIPVHTDNPLETLDRDQLLGLRRPRIGNGTGSEILQWLRETADVEDDTSGDLWETLAEERAIRRQMAQEAKE